MISEDSAERDSLDESSAFLIEGECESVDLPVVFQISIGKKKKKKKTDLPLLQIAMLLLRHCACPRIQFLLRTVPATSTGEAAWSHDDQIRTTLAALLGEEELSDSQWRQASLRLAVGGLGLGSARRDRIAAYLGPAADCLRNFPTNFAILGDAEEAWTDHGSTPQQHAASTGA